MGKTQSREQIVIAQNGAGNKADAGLLHEITHDKLDILITMLAITILIITCCLVFRFGKMKYAKFLRQNLGGPRASTRRVHERPAPVYNVA